MLETEAEWIGRVLTSLPKDHISPLCNLGASTKECRKIIQPHINKYIFEPLEKNDVTIFHVDLKEGDGIDISGDILDDNFLKKIRLIKFKSILCSNMLEHVREPEKVAKRLLSIIPKDSYLLITAPYSYPYHPDPIDNMLRVNLEELHALFPNTQIIHEKVIEGETYWDTIKNKPPKFFLRLILRTVAIFYRFDVWCSHIDYLKWLFRKYKISCILLKKSQND